MHFPIAVASALAIALPGVLAQADEIKAHADKELEWQVKLAIRNDPQPESDVTYTPSDDIVAQQLSILGGDDGYKPYPVACPAGETWVRPATDGLGQGEKDYIAKRWPSIETAFKSMMQQAGLPEAPRTPVISLALSGGGYRAMINGLGMTMGMMADTEEAKTAGTGGWLDAVTYMAGLSGGSWATGTYVANNGMMPTDLIKNVWGIDSNLIFPSDDKLTFYTRMLSNVRAKAGEGFPTQITDYWALALGEHLLPGEWRMNTSANATFDRLLSDVPKLGNAEVPFPIIIAAEREPGQYVIGDNATVWEFTPYEFGAWAIGDDQAKTAGYFSPIEYLGTAMNGGQPNGTCYKGFDQLSFVMGTSSTLFNGGILQLSQVNDTGVVLDIIKKILEEISDDQNDISQVPNPLQGYTAQTNPLSSYQYLTLVDAGLTNQNVPLEPLIMSARQVDTILAFDNSADTNYSWPNGSALWTTYNRALRFAEQKQIPLLMPEVPSTDGFVAGGLNQRPVFFGCNRTDVPLVVYVPHYPWTWYSNSSTYELAYENDKATLQMENAMRSFTLNGTVPTWPKCLACAMSDRAFGYTSENRSSECAECFDTWCWNGVDAQASLQGEYEPVLGVTPSFLAEKNLSSSVQTQGMTTAQAETAKDKNDKNAATALLSGRTVAGVIVGVVSGAALLVL